MKKNKFILLAMLLVLISLFASACNVRTQTSESYTDADGNTTTTTTTNDNGEISTETTTSSGDEEEEDAEAEEEAEEDEGAEEEAEEGAESSDIPDDVTSFAEALTAVINEYGSEIAITETVDVGGGNYTILTDSELISFVVVTDGSSATKYSVTIMGESEDLNKGMYTMLIAALLEDDERNEAYEAVVTRKETPVEKGYYTFTADTGEANGLPYSSLSADVN